MVVLCCLIVREIEMGGLMQVVRWDAGNRGEFGGYFDDGGQFLRLNFAALIVAVG